MVCTVDTDVLILATRALHYLETVEESRLAFGSGKKLSVSPCP